MPIIVNDIVNNFLRLKTSFLILIETKYIINGVQAYKTPECEATDNFNPSKKQNWFIGITNVPKTKNKK